MSGGIHIGCSGYYYEHWIGSFYPEGTRSGDFFAFYQEKFSTVELNTTFYHFPREAQVESWNKKSREGFIFTVKAPRIITHVKKLKDCRENLLLFLHLIKPLKESSKLGAILFQTPPSFTCDIKVLEDFVSILPQGYRFACEFRNRALYREDVYGILADKGVDFASVSEKNSVPFDGCIAPFKYFRMHGVQERYASNYSEEDLKSLAGKMLQAWDGGKREVFAYFNNDYGAYAPSNAARLREIVQRGS
jgi:uncharacterized protein YecE (DUF72 family)